MRVVEQPSSDCTEFEARRLTERIKVAVGATWELVIEAYTRRAHAALGFSSWDAYCDEEFDGHRIRLPREARQEVVGSLRDAGLSTRAIAAAAGISDHTVRADLKAGARNHAPEPDPTFGGYDPDPLVDPGDDDDDLDFDAEDPVFEATVDPGDEAGVEAPAAPTPAPAPLPAPTITGTDGKTYPAATRRPPLPVSKEERDRLHRAEGLRDLYSGLLRAVQVCAGYGGYADIGALWSEFEFSLLLPPSLEEVLTIEVLTEARQLIDWLITWTEENR